MVVLTASSSVLEPPLESGAQFSLYGLRIWMRPEAPSMVRLSKSVYYLIDNHICYYVIGYEGKRSRRKWTACGAGSEWESRAHPLRKGRGEG